MMTGVLTEEGVLMAYFLKESIDRLSTKDVGYFIENTVIPSLLNQMQQITDSLYIRDVIKFEYFDEIRTKTKSQIIDSIIRFFTDIYFLAPLIKQLKLNINSRSNFVYFNNYPSPDIFGNKLNITTASHGSDLLYIFRTYYVSKISITTFSIRYVSLTDLLLIKYYCLFPTIYYSDERLSRNFKGIFGDFIANGRILQSWKPFTEQEEFVYDLDSGTFGRNYQNDRAYKFWYKFLPTLSLHNPSSPSEKNFAFCPNNTSPNSAPGNYVYYNV